MRGFAVYLSPSGCVWPHWLIDSLCVSGDVGDLRKGPHKADSGFEYGTDVSEGPGKRMCLTDSSWNVGEITSWCTTVHKKIEKEKFTLTQIQHGL